MLNFSSSTEFEQEAAANRGHNSGARGTTEWADLLDPEAVLLSLEMDHEDLVERKDSLLKSVERFNAAHPKGIVTETDSTEATDFGKQIKEAAKRIEDTRVLVKAPFYNADKAVQAFFIGLKNPLDEAVKKIEKNLSTYQRKKAEDERIAREQEAAAMLAEAERTAGMAAETGNADIIEQAEIQFSAADKAAKQAAEPPTSMSRSRGNFAVSSGSTVYKFTVTDKSKIPLEYMIVDEAKIKKSINAKKDRVKEIPGVEITEDFQSRIR